MEKTIPHVPDVKALIIGDGRDRSTLERFCRERGLGAHVLFLGFQENIADYYQVLDLLVQPSFSEGLPNTVLGSNVLRRSGAGDGGRRVPEIIQDGNGVMVPPNDPDSLAGKMIELLRDGGLRQAIGARGRSSLHPRFGSRPPGSAPRSRSTTSCWPSVPGPGTRSRCDGLARSPTHGPRRMQPTPAPRAAASIRQYPLLNEGLRGSVSYGIPASASNLTVSTRRSVLPSDNLAW